MFMGFSYFPLRFSLAATPMAMTRILLPNSLPLWTHTGCCQCLEHKLLIVHISAGAPRGYYTHLRRNHLKSWKTI
ncbi:hypothetical protein F5888DRAFT_1644377 [Russula emetica]|nr:hypothetical protein F5888DRAFT_1644377 [Russula emetica]